MHVAFNAKYTSAFSVSVHDLVTILLRIPDLFTIAHALIWEAAVSVARRQPDQLLPPDLTKARSLVEQAAHAKAALASLQMTGGTTS